MSKRTLLSLTAIIGSVLSGTSAGAELPLVGPGTPQPDTPGRPDESKVEVISQNGGLTRKPCPYNCEERSLAKEFCKTWKSKDGTLCYVWDTRLPQNAVPVGD